LLFCHSRHHRATIDCRPRSQPRSTLLHYPWPRSTPPPRPRLWSAAPPSSSSSLRHCRATTVDLNPAYLGAHHRCPLPQALDTIVPLLSTSTPPPSISSPKHFFFIISVALVILNCKPCYAGYSNDLNVLINRYLSSCFCYMI
jgi:hypothetical protein